MRNILTILLACTLFTPALNLFAKASESESKGSVFAIVNDEIITTQTYLAALRAGGRQRFYHRKAPADEIEAFKDEISSQLIEERLLHQEAIKRSIEPDEIWVNNEFKKIEKQYSRSPEWNDNYQVLSIDIINRLRERSRVSKITEVISTAPDPSESELLRFYEGSPDTFTSPEQVKLSTILLQVEPWQPKVEWDKALEESQKILSEIRDGTSFDSLLEQHPNSFLSSDSYIHHGMLSTDAQNAVDKLLPGEISDSVTLLEGVAIFRLDERISAKLNPLSQVRERAIALWKREKTELVRNEALKSLRDNATVEIVLNLSQVKMKQ